MKTEFLKYCKQERREFVNKFIQTKPNKKERVIAEDLLIAYDQLMEQNEVMIDILVESKKEFELLIEHTHIEGVHETENILNAIRQTLKKEGVTDE